MKREKKIKKKKKKYKSETEARKNREQSESVQTMTTSILDMAYKTRNITGNNRACSNKRNRKDKCSSSQKPSVKTVK